VQVNARIDYAVRAVVEVASRSADRPVSSSEIAEAQQIPSKFLESILLTLRQGGLLLAQRGTAGGYLLARPAATITIADILRVVDGPLAGVRGLSPEETSYPAPAGLLRDVWVALRASMRTVLEATTVADVVAGALPEPVAALLGSPDAWVRR
jgi:Rrf2 family protein